MDSVRLLQRMDTKFLLPATTLPSLFKELHSEYRCLHVNDRSGADYRTLYFDTPEFVSYYDHHNGRTFRNKVRMREYVGSDLAFLEIKRKTGRGGTDKVRMRIEQIRQELDQRQQAFVYEALGEKIDLQATLWNSFTRYTLVHKQRPERLTIDVNLQFERDGRQFDVPDLVICELKQERVAPNSTFYAAMRKRLVRPAGMSKYCLGLIKSDPGLKKNKFKPTLLQIERIQNAA